MADGQGIPRRPVRRDEDGEPLVLSLQNVEEVVGPTRSIPGRCHCDRRYQPLHAVEDTLRLLQPSLLGFDPELNLLTYRCSRCKGIAQLTLQAVGLLPKR